MAVRGIVTKCAKIGNKTQHLMSHCDATSKYSNSFYHDQTSLTGFPTGSAYPTKDDQGNPLTTEFGWSTFADSQTLTVQEMPEMVPSGLMPCAVEVSMLSDLCGSCKAGDRVEVVGIFQGLANNNAGESSAFFKTILVATNVNILSQKPADVLTKFDPDDMKQFAALKKRKDLFDLLAHSIAPSIFGHEMIKKAIVLYLLGGRARDLPSGTHIRGDINMLLVGDPSTAKSQLLRFVLALAPLALNTTGRGSSGAGLTAAVLQDRDTGEWRVEGGAMVLADGGYVCIDEFDKMSDQDRVTIHEAMEQQTVTIAKAGLSMTLNARVSVLAAANPIYGKYDTGMSLHRNIALPDSLLSRFDLTFVTLDVEDPELDRQIARRVIRNHMAQARPGGSAGGSSSAAAAGAGEAAAAEDKKDPKWIYQRYDKNLHFGLPAPQGRVDLLTVSFLKSYLEYAKNRAVDISFPAEAQQNLTAKYVQIRQGTIGGAQADRSMPITARMMDTLVRLSTAHCKMRLGDKIEEQDCEAAFDLIRFSLDAVNRTAAAHGSGRGDSSDEDDDDVDGDDEAKGKGKSSARSPARGTPKRRRDAPTSEDESEGAASGDDDVDDDDDGDGNAGSARGRGKKGGRRSRSRSRGRASSPLRSPGKRARKGPASSAAEGEDTDEEANLSQSAAARRGLRGSQSPARAAAVASPSKGRSPARRSRMVDDDDEAEEGEEEKSSSFTAAGAAASAALPAIPAARVEQFRKLLTRFMQSQQDPDTTTLGAALPGVNALLTGGDKPFSKDDAEAALEVLQARNRFMYRLGYIYSTN